MMNTIERAEQQFINDYIEVGDWLLQFQMMIELTDDVESIPEEERCEENRIRSCQSMVWVDCRMDNGKMLIREYSDSLIIRAVLAVYVYLINRHTPEEIVAFSPRYVSETSLKEQLNSDRQNGFASIVEKIRKYAAKQLDR